MQQRRSTMRSVCQLLIPLLLPLAAGAIAADGESPDRPRSERDLAVIAQMLAGHYANANQAYFERRLKDPESSHHKSREVQISTTPETNRFAIAINSSDSDPIQYEATLLEDGAEVQMLITNAAGAKCTYLWQREAAQFRAKPVNRCGKSLPSGWVLSQPELWIYPTRASKLSGDNAYRYHRSRAFTCYADIPGVGGGRATPFERYTPLELHDQGGEAWFTTREDTPRNLGISMFLVDWPMNNAAGIFTRNSLVVYVNERLADGSSKEHGYAFTEPDARRLGINLKWLLALCFMESNENATPQM